MSKQKTDNPGETPQYETANKPKREVKQDPIIEARRKWRDAETKLNNMAPRLKKLQFDYDKAKYDEDQAREAFNALIRESNLIPKSKTA